MVYDDPDYDDEAWDESSDRCPDCGAYPEEYHEMDCGYSDDDDDIDAEVMDCTSPYHPVPARAAIRGVRCMGGTSD